LIADSTSLSGVLGTLKKRQFTFVMVGSEISGIVTRADLNKPPCPHLSFQHYFIAGNALKLLDSR
jgi:hypothetical protein